MCILFLFQLSPFSTEGPLRCSMIQLQWSSVTIMIVISLEGYVLSPSTLEAIGRRTLEGVLAEMTYAEYSEGM